jgi:aryl-alcohol dehydrogenase-like predicted oxidoreductase
MEALNDLVRSGKVRYIGCSSCYAWEFQKANNIAEKNGWAKFVSMQNLYNPLYREEEREMYPYCADSGIAVIPWSPLGWWSINWQESCYYSCSVMKSMGYLLITN